MKKIGFVTDFAPQKLKQGYGEIICNVLNGLADFTLERKNFKFRKPVYPEPNPEDDFDEVINLIKFVCEILSRKKKKVWLLMRQ